MDIDADSFPSKLLGLLINISEADFVSFDLELSGIPSRLPAKAKPGATGRKTLEDRYLETRVAADRYQILQVGITCGRFDYLKEKYVLRPYNITLSPLLRERLDFEREICIQSGAASFLLDHDFDMGAPFRDGVQYLSRQEAELAEQLAHDRIEKKNVVEDLHLKEEDVDSLDFVRRVRKAIITWKNADDDSSLVITTHTGLSEQPPVSAISRFEKRLVHQLVRAEFEDLVSLGRADCIRIIRYDALREEENTKRLKRRVKEQIARQTGFRWVFEALADGDLDQAAPFYFPSSVSDQIIAPQTTQTKDRFDLARARLRKRQPVLVGHNMFTDLVYFYRTFVGELPDTLDGFCEAIHALFPKIIDTKYLATHAEGDLNASPTLQEIAEKLQDQPLPDIVTHPDHDKYHQKAAYHEAGFDSLLTATILLRLAANLGVKHEDKTPQAFTDTSLGTSFPSTPGKQPGPTNSDANISKPAAPSPIEAPLQTAGPGHKRKKKKASKNKRRSANDASQPRFHTRNLFDSLREVRLDAQSEHDRSSSEEEQQGSVAANGSDETKCPPTAWQDERYTVDTSAWVPIQTIQRKPMELIPSFDSDFWDGFGNTLRVYGTQEALLRIAKWGRKA